MSSEEFLSRLRHLKNVFEVACLSSDNHKSFNDIPWQLAREYDSRVISDIESGIKDWSTLSRGLETDALYCANQTVDLKGSKKPNKESEPGKSKDANKKDVKKACTTYNSHRSSEGCYWEHNNPGQVCIFEHYCSYCKSNRDTKEKHKLFQCEHKTDE